MDINLDLNFRRRIVMVSRIDFFSDRSPQNLEIVNSDCFSSIMYSWEDRIDGDGDYNDMEYTVSCEYPGGEKTLSVTSRLSR